ncbi:MAG: phage baseplate assembly protein V [Gemmatimonadaceae bacterium]
MSQPDSAFKVGRVIERDAATARVRVVFPDYDDLPSWWLPVLHQKTLLDQTYWIPDIDEHVICLVDQRAEAGVVIGAIYSALTPPPIASLEKRFVKFSDGTEVEYDRATHTLRIALVADDADIEVVTTGNITLEVPEGKKVILGDPATAQELATKDFVESIFLTHTHPTPAGMSAAPVPTGTELAWPHITERGVSR